MSKKYRHITAQEFKKIKVLQEAGISIGHVSAVTTRSWPTIQLIYRSDSFDDYQLKMQSRNKKPVKKPMPPTKDPETDNKAAYSALMLLTRRSVEAQERQAAALEALVKAWESAPARKKLF